jgi:hypothetical protein
MEVRSPGGYEKAAEKISAEYGCAVLCKGGHRLNDANDLLWRGDRLRWFTGKKINNPNTHGTGCTLSSAIAANLAKGYGPGGSRRAGQRVSFRCARGDARSRRGQRADGPRLRPETRVAEGAANERSAKKPPVSRTDLSGSARECPSPRYSPAHILPRWALQKGCGDNSRPYHRLHDVFLRGAHRRTHRQKRHADRRLSFGRIGCLFFASLNVLQLVGWTAIMIYDGALATNGVIGAGRWVWCAVIGALILLWIAVGVTNLNWLNKISDGGAAYCR